MYADDVVLFLCPTLTDIDLTLNILQLFGDASGLHNNVKKSNVYPIRCSEEVLLEVQTLMPCEISTFLCRYLGLPLSLRKLTRQQFQPFVDKIADQLPNWKVDLMTRARRRVQVQHVLTTLDDPRPQGTKRRTSQSTDPWSPSRLTSNLLRGRNTKPRPIKSASPDLGIGVAPDPSR